MAETIIVNFDKEYSSIIRNIRNEVFSLEQQVPEKEDFDGNDPGAIHVLVKDQGKFVGTGRMLKDGHIGRLAVLNEHRGKGFGSDAILTLIEEAKRLNIKRLFLGAQMHAAGFYRKLGFTEYGEPFMEVNIEHIHMEMFL